MDGRLRRRWLPLQYRGSAEVRVFWTSELELYRYLHH